MVYGVWYEVLQSHDTVHSPVGGTAVGVLYK